MILKMIIGFFISLAVMFFAMPPFIEYLKKQSLRQTVSEYALPEDQKKAGTPIMGGVLFIVIPVIMTLILMLGAVGDLETWVVLLAFVGYGIIGFIDDYLIAIKKNNEGLKPMYKFAMQLVIAVVFYFMYKSHATLDVVIPFVSHPVNFGVFYFLLIVLMFTGSSNAVNLTDGMDGLAAGVTIIALIPFLVFSLKGHKEGCCIFIACLLGALLGYLYYNKKPARVFMGDSGSLALGGALAALAMVTKKELLLVLIAGVPVIDTLTVILQVLAVKTIHRRIFTYTPIHFAFRIKGMPETSVVRMFWLVEALFAGLAIWIGLK